MTHAAWSAKATAPQPQTAGAGSALAPSATTGQVSGSRHASFGEDVPSLLNRLQVLAVGACVVFAVLATVVQVLSFQADRRAADNTEQVVRVQKIQSSLLRADALATNAFLVGGLEPADARAAYDRAIDDTLRLITDAADAQPADRAVLADLNVAVRTYTTAVAQARDYNRQNLTISIAYLNSAGDALRDRALPIVEALVDANSQRARDEMTSQHPWWLFGIGAAALAVLWWINQSLARRFHRHLNVGLLVAAIVVAVLTVATALHAGGRNGDNEATRDGPYRSAVDEASVRTAANDAKAQESQGLINRGAGPAYEELWADRADVVVASASPQTLRLWNLYVEQHDRVRAFDDAGNWERARDLATSTDPDGPTAILDELDHTAAQVVSTSADEATAAFRSGGVAAVLLLVLTLLGGLLAAAATAWGINQRRREYA